MMRRYLDLIAASGMRAGSYRVALVAGYLLAALIAGGLWRFDSAAMERNLADLALERGQMVFQLIQLTRRWNASHEGVYVPVTPQTPVNPSLEHPRRDLTTTDGQALTMVNPAYMTRQLSEMAEAEGLGSLLGFHITSLRPIRRENAPDPWEALALKQFEAGLTEKLELVSLPPLKSAEGGVSSGVKSDGESGRSVFRYMAPLRISEPCLKCHAKYGYQLGEIRGGISATMDAASLRAVIKGRHLSNSLTHLGIFLMTGMLFHALVWGFRNYAVGMLRIQRDQEATISARTHDLAVSEARYRAIFQAAAEGILVADADAVVRQVNPGMESLTGYSALELIGKKANLLKSGRHDSEFYASMWRDLNEKGNWQGEIWNRRKNGDLFVAWLAISRVDAEQAGDGRDGYVATYVDITERKADEVALQHQAHHDALTGLPNRSLFADRFHAALSTAYRHQRQMALMYLDLDHFKEVNDSLGHAAGDELLMQVASRLSAGIRGADSAARLGGDEFAVLLGEIHGHSEATDVAQRLVTSLAEPYMLKSGKARISVSIGIAYYPEHGLSATVIRQHADEALYRVKHHGRNGFSVYSPENN
jgi:diguanylate cyclase (GGDEF)-like protein/PAS domain S-box-containing protein